MPGWQFFGGVNDRFAIASAGLASETYANRLDTIFQHLTLTNRPFHSEQYLFDILALRKIRVLPIVQTRFVRIRSGKVLHPEKTQHENIQHPCAAASWTLLTEQLMTTRRRLREGDEKIENLKETQSNLEHKILELESSLYRNKQKVRKLRSRVKALNNNN